MNVSAIKSKISSYSNRTINGLTSLLPSITVDSKKLLKGIKWAGEHISSPQNRLILGASALLSQPFIDLYNKRVDEDTRKSSAARTVAKIIAGTTSGFVVRYYTIKAIEKMTQSVTKNKKWWQTFFTPDPKLVKITARALGQYKKAIGSIVALGVIVITNFLFDAPVTKKLTNAFIDLIKKRDTKKSTKKHIIQQGDILNTNYTNTPTSSTNLIDQALIKYSNQKQERSVKYD